MSRFFMVHCVYTHMCVDIARPWLRRSGSHDTLRTSRGLWRHRQKVERPTPCCRAASNTATINWSGLLHCTIYMCVPSNTTRITQAHSELLQTCTN